MREALYYKKEPLFRVRCVLCPHRCQLHKGQAGLCRVRVNHDGELMTTAYDEVAAYGLDPVEKKPLYHFLPGKSLLTYSTNGCTFHCTFCSNHAISQRDSPTVHLGVSDLVDLAKGHGAVGLAASYGEPVVYFEFARDAARAARDQGLKSVAVTNGFILEGPLREWLKGLDALKVDLKGNDVFYREVCGGQADPVWRTIRIAWEAKVHVEVAMPLIPSLNDYHEDIEEMVAKLAEISPDIPFHIQAYSPAYKMSVDATPPEALVTAYGLAAEKLKYVYLQNVTGMTDKQTTYCPGCREALVVRDGNRMLENRLKEGKCPRCDCPIPGVFA